MFGSMLERFLRAQTGLVFEGVRRAHLHDVVARLARLAGRSDDEYVADLISGGPGLDDVLAEITIGETYFFRDLEALEVLQREIIPAQLAARPDDHRYRAWSAGCSTGEEAYTLAMLCEDAGLTDRYDVLGTDLSAAALVRAHAGVYRDWSLRGTGVIRARNRLERHDETFVVPDALRRAVRFELLNLTSDPYPSLATGTVGLDVILCRNVLIYVDAATVTRVVERLFAALAPGGWLLTAATDPPLHRLAPWSTSRVATGVLYARGPVPDVLMPAQDPVLRRPSAPPRPRKRAPAPIAVSPAPIAAAPVPSPTAAAQVRSLADRGQLEAALAVARESAARDTRNTELQYLVSVIAFEQGVLEEAAAAVRRTLYLDPSMALAHFLDGAVAMRRGLRDAARRAFRNARRILVTQPADDPVALGDGLCSGRLVAQIDAQLAQLEVAS